MGGWAAARWVTEARKVESTEAVAPLAALAVRAVEALAETRAEWEAAADDPAEAMMEVTTEAITEAAREAATGRPPSPQTVWPVTRAGVVQNTRREPK